MASSSGCCLNPKQSKSIYTEDWKWKEKPTIRNPSNNIYTPYRKRNMKERLMKHEKKIRSNKVKGRKTPYGMKRSGSSYAVSRQSSGGYEGEEEQGREEYYRSSRYSSSRGSRKKRPSTAGSRSRYSYSQSNYSVGAPVFDDNPTYSDFYSDVSEKTNKLKGTLYGKRYGNYVNKPLVETVGRAKPKVRGRGARDFRKRPKNMVVSKDLKEYYEDKFFKDTFYYDDRTKRVPNRTGDNQVIEKLARERKKILKDDNLFEGMMKLKRLNLLKKHGHKIKVNKHRNKGYTFNDYHDKLTKDGYARNTLGTFYYR